MLLGVLELEALLLLSGLMEAGGRGRGRTQAVGLIDGGEGLLTEWLGRELDGRGRRRGLMGVSLSGRRRRRRRVWVVGRGGRGRWGSRGEWFWRGGGGRHGTRIGGYRG